MSQVKQSTLQTMPLPAETAEGPLLNAGITAPQLDHIYTAYNFDKITKNLGEISFGDRPLAQYREFQKQVNRLARVLPSPGGVSENDEAKSLCAYLIGQVFLDKKKPNDGYAVLKNLERLGDLLVSAGTVERRCETLQALCRLSLKFPPEQIRELIQMKGSGESGDWFKLRPDLIYDFVSWVFTHETTPELAPTQKLELAFNMTSSVESLKHLTLEVLQERYRMGTKLIVDTGDPLKIVSDLTQIYKSQCDSQDFVCWAVGLQQELQRHDVPASRQVEILGKVLLFLQELPGELLYRLPPADCEKLRSITGTNYADEVKILRCSWSNLKGLIPYSIRYHRAQAELKSFLDSGQGKDMSLAVAIDWVGRFPYENGNVFESEHQKIKLNKLLRLLDFGAARNNGIDPKIALASVFSILLEGAALTDSPKAISWGTAIENLNEYLAQFSLGPRRGAALRELQEIVEQVGPERALGLIGFGLPPFQYRSSKDSYREYLLAAAQLLNKEPELGISPEVMMYWARIIFPLSRDSEEIGFEQAFTRCLPFIKTLESSEHRLVSAILDDASECYPPAETLDLLVWIGGLCLYHEGATEAELVRSKLLSSVQETFSPSRRSYYGERENRLTRMLEQKNWMGSDYASRVPIAGARFFDLATLADPQLDLFSRLDPQYGDTQSLFLLRKKLESIVGNHAANLVARIWRQDSLDASGNHQRLDTLRQRLFTAMRLFTFMRSADFRDDFRFLEKVLSRAENDKILDGLLRDFLELREKWGIEALVSLREFDDQLLGLKADFTSLLLFGLGLQSDNALKRATNETYVVLSLFSDRETVIHSEDLENLYRAVHRLNLFKPTADFNDLPLEHLFEVGGGMNFDEHRDVIAWLVSRLDQWDEEQVPHEVQHQRIEKIKYELNVEGPGGNFIGIEEIERAFELFGRYEPISGSFRYCSPEFPARRRTREVIEEPVLSPEEQRKQELYRKIFEDLQVPIETAFLALCALGETKESRHKYQEYRNLVIRHISTRSGRETKDAPATPIERFKEFIDLNSTSDFKVDFTDIGKGRFTELLKQLCYRHYSGDYSKMLQELHEYQSGAELQSAEFLIADRILKDIVPRLSHRFEQTLKFRMPDTIRPTVKRLPYQCDAVAAALYDDRPIVIGGPGSGKTQIGAIFAQTLQAGALWCTKNSVRSDSFKRLKHDILDPSVRISELTKSDAHASPERLKEILTDADVVVVGMDTLRSMHALNPDAFEVVQKWTLPRKKIIDEAHLLDNPASGRSLALQSLPSNGTLLLTATPYQHRPERTATLLHLALPARFPNPGQLTGLLRDDPNLARALLHAHSTCFGIEDIAKHFEPFSQRSAAEQLADGIPRIPRLTVHRHSYAISKRHSALYADIALNYEQWAHAARHDSKRQFVALRHLATDPERLDAGPPHAMIAAIKQIALPALERGEKVLIMGFHLRPLTLIAADPELQKAGIKLISGETENGQRIFEVSALETDPDKKIMAAQLDVGSTGLNFRAVTHIIFFERPKMTSGLVQAMRRHVRILTKGEEHFAREHAHVHFLEPALDPEFVERAPPEMKRYLKRGMIHSEWLSYDLRREAAYTSFVNPGSKHAQNASSVSIMLQRLSALHRELESARGKFQLMSADGLSDHFYRFRTPVKNTWRDADVGEFCRVNGTKLLADPKDLRVACLPGPEALEVDIYLKMGVRPENIDGFEADANESVREYCRKRMEDAGCRLFTSKIEDVIPFEARPYHIVSADLNGQVTPGILQMFSDTRLADSSLILKNSLGQRERGPGQELLAEAYNDRRRLDYELVKLAATGLRNATLHKSSQSMLELSIRIHEAALLFAHVCTERFGGNQETWGECIADIGRGSRLVRDIKQVAYRTPHGRPFLSTFAHLDRWPDDLSASNEFKSIQSTLRGLCVAANSSERAVINLNSLRLDSTIMERIYELHQKMVLPASYWNVINVSPLELLEVV